MPTSKEQKKDNKGNKKQTTSGKKGSKGVNVDSTPATERVKPKAGSTLHDEGTNVSYDEQR